MTQRSHRDFQVSLMLQVLILILIAFQQSKRGPLPTLKQLCSLSAPFILSILTHTHRGEAAQRHCVEYTPYN